MNRRFLALLTASSLLPPVSSSAVELSGNLVFGPSLLSYADGAGAASKSNALSGLLTATSPLPGSLFIFTAQLDKKLIVTPYREEDAEIRWTNLHLPGGPRALRYSVYGGLGRYSDQVFTSANHTSSRFGGSLGVPLTSRLNVTAGFDTYQRAVQLQANGYATNLFTMRGDYRYGNNDLLTAGVRLFSRNHRTDLFDYRQIGVTLGRLFNLSGRRTFNLGWDYEQLRNDLAAMRTADLNQHTASAAWYLPAPNVSRRVSASLKLLQYPSGTNADSTVLRAAYSTDRPPRGAARWRRSNRHELAYYRYQDPTPGYLDYQWDFGGQQVRPLPVNPYLENRLYVRRFQNTSLVKNQHFYDEQIETGVYFSGAGRGILKAGGLTGVRVFDDPGRGTNTNPDDNSLFGNPLNYFLYGARVTGGFAVTRESDFNLTCAYREFINFAATPNRTSTDEFVFDADYSLRIDERWLFSVVSEIGQQSTDLGPVATGNGFRNFAIRFTYSFGTYNGRTL